jgi:hypothetical protein
MASECGGILREVRKLFQYPTPGSPPDHELLKRFWQHHDEAAFGELVRRHGTLVLGMCRRVLKTTVGDHEQTPLARLTSIRWRPDQQETTVPRGL